MIRTRLATAALAAALAAAVCGGCSSSSKSSSKSSTAPQSASAAPSASGYASASASPTPTAAASGGTSVATASVGKFGPILVGPQGKTLYLFEKDTSTTSTCYGACAAQWPPAVVTGTPQAGNGIDAAKLSTSPRNDGTTQVVYNGHPLYSYAGDSAPGQAKGEESTAFGAKWYVVNPQGSKVEGD